MKNFILFLVVLMSIGFQSCTNNSEKYLEYEAKMNELTSELTFTEQNIDERHYIMYGDNVSLIFYRCSDSVLREMITANVCDIKDVDERIRRIKILEDLTSHFPKTYLENRFLLDRYKCK